MRSPAILEELNPVKFVFKEDKSSKLHSRCIAEYVPDVIGNADKTMISTMDIIGVLTKVIKEQQQSIKELTKKLKSFPTQGE